MTDPLINYDSWVRAMRVSIMGAAIARLSLDMVRDGPPMPASIFVSPSPLARALLGACRDVDSPTIVTGTVDAVSGDVVTLTLDSTWTPGSSTWNLCFSPSTTADIATRQLGYAFIARQTFRVQLSSGTRDPSRFTP